MKARPARRTPAARARTPGDAPGDARGDVPSADARRGRVPLWGQVHAVEAALRPVVPPRPTEPMRIPWLHLAVGSGLLGGASVAGALVVHRRGLMIARLQRPRQLQGAPIAGLRGLARPDVLAAAWRPGASAMGVGLALWLVTVAHPRWRAPLLRWGWLLGLAGVAAYVVFTLQLMPLRR